MPKLQIDLTEGFAGDTVAVRVGGREVYRQDGVSTNYSSGVAGRVEADVAEGPVPVEVELPARGERAGLTARVEGDSFVAVSLSPDGRLAVTQLGAMPRYL
ncbi:MAG TPA: hypothetical protein VFJ16_32580 [Longimicrobium sp.]|nr:hypothetical protein [Longimicrobium sp.]